MKQLVEFGDILFAANEIRLEISINGKPLKVSRTAGSETEIPFFLNRLENLTVLSTNPSAVGRGRSIFSVGMTV